MFEKKNSIKDLLGETDIYIIDQIMKNRYNQQEKILDAGCGNGRNLYWFLQNEFEAYGIDTKDEFINTLKKDYPDFPEDRFRVSFVEKTSFADNYFDHIICSAVLHFANNISHFKEMLGELIRILKPGGSLFIRMASDIGLENKIELIGEGVYLIPDGSKRFLLTKELLKVVMKEFKLIIAEPMKTTNVDDKRYMSTLVLLKES